MRINCLKFLIIFSAFSYGICQVPEECAARSVGVASSVTSSLVQYLIGNECALNNPSEFPQDFGPSALKQREKKIIKNRYKKKLKKPLQKNLKKTVIKNSKLKMVNLISVIFQVVFWTLLTSLSLEVRN